MRPKKTVLCVCMDDEDLSRRVFLLDTRGFSVVRAESASEAAAAIDRAAGGLDALMIVLPLTGAAELLAEGRRKDVEMRSLVVGNNCWAYTADSLLPSASDNTGMIVERLQVLVRRKRGPKKDQGRGTMDQETTTGAAA